MKNYKIKKQLLLKYLLGGFLSSTLLYLNLNFVLPVLNLPFLLGIRYLVESPSKAILLIITQLPILQLPILLSTLQLVSLLQNLPVDNTIYVNKTKRTLTYKNKSYPISISKKGLEAKSKNGDGYTPEGVFLAKLENHRKDYHDSELGYRPTAYGSLGKVLRLSGNSDNGFNINSSGILVHGTDKYNDPSYYGLTVGKTKVGTHGCIGMKDNDLADLLANIGNNKVLVKITKAKLGRKLLNKYLIGGPFSTYTPISNNNYTNNSSFIDYSTNYNALTDLFYQKLPVLQVLQLTILQPMLQLLVLLPVLLTLQTQLSTPILLATTNQYLQNNTSQVKQRLEHSYINPNCRDLGGLGKIKYGFLFRGGLYGGDLKRIKDLGITHEIAVTGNKKHLPLPDENRFGGDWRHLSDKQKGEVLSKCMQWVTEGKKVYIHCDRGCDRTGVFCAILEGILGTPREDIISDFKLSDTKGKGYKISHPDNTINRYLKTYGGNALTTLDLQRNFMDNVSKKYGVDKNLMLQFIKAATDDSIVSKKRGGILVNKNYHINKEIKNFFYNI